MKLAIFGLIMFAAGFLVPRDAFPWMKRLSAWFMRERDNEKLGRWVIAIAFAILCLFVATGCTSFRPLKGGGATIGQQVNAKAETGHASTAPSPDSPPVATLTPPENPAASSGQETSFEKTVEVFIPVESSVTTETVKPDGGKVTVTETFPAGTVRRESVKQGVKQSIGGAQKDMGREIAAKLAQYSKLQFVGVALLVAAAAGYFYPPLKLILGGGKQFPAAVAMIGAGLIIAPMLIAGNEGKILLGAVIIGGGAWGLIRLTRKEAEADLNKNGVPDRLEPDHFSQ